MVVDMGQASVSMLQRRFKIGYSRAGRIIDQMEDRGLISGYDGSKPRQVLISKNEWQELKMAANGGTESSNNSVSDNNIDYDLEN
jgi:S-DNA-T family DNA segregation ATPase FtsK/SpoIIIE